MNYLESGAGVDALPFGVIGMKPNGVVVTYNAFESRAAGLYTGTVIGRHFFTEIGPCTNNYLIAGRFETEPQLDVIIDYVLTLRMAPTKVRLRLLKSPEHPHMYLLVERR